MADAAAKRRPATSQTPSWPELVEPDVTGMTEAEAWDALNAAYQQNGRDGFAALGVEYDAELYEWSQVPPFPMCGQCFEWRRYPAGQRHFGLAWWKICSWQCSHEHHADEEWANGNAGL